MAQWPITIEFATLIVGILAGGIGVFWWLTIQFANLKKDIDEQFAALRKERSEESVRISEKIDGLGRQLADHKLDVAEKYVSKSSFSIVADKISTEIGRMDSKIEARLMRIEDRLNGRVSPPQP